MMEHGHAHRRATLNEKSCQRFYRRINAVCRHDSDESVIEGYILAGEQSGKPSRVLQFDNHGFVSHLASSTLHTAAPDGSRFFL